MDYVMRLRWLPANQAWVFTWGDLLVSMRDVHLHPSRDEAVRRANQAGLNVHEEGLVTVARPVPPAEPKYRVGDLDPTPDDGPYCDAAQQTPPGGPIYGCTWHDPHPGIPHVAGTGERIAAVWE